MTVKLAELEANSVDSCVTDPPYHLTSIVKRFGADDAAPAKSGKTGVYARSSKGFMGKTWDGGDLAFQPETWEAVLRVLKPGGYLLAFAAAKNAHRMTCAIEDAGFEIRDCLMWLYGSGFPKSHNLDGEWKGWGSALKPAYEPIVMARKPLIGTIAQNVEAHGVGAINIDACRIEFSDGDTTSRAKSSGLGAGRATANAGAPAFGHGLGGVIAPPHELGRWPANVIHDGSDEVLAGFPWTKSGSIAPHHKRTTSKTKNTFAERAAPPEETFGDEGSAARFFYCAKASRTDRNEGLDDLPEKPLLWSSGDKNPGSFQSDGTKKKSQNNHPTVKPTELMRYLCRLVTPPGGLVLDPFAGSGSTGKAAALEGFRFVGVELGPEYAAIAQHRIWHAQGMDWLA